MSNVQIYPQGSLAIPPIALAPDGSSWYAIQTMARHEKRVNSQLQEKGIFTFLPLLQEVHQWSDRRRKVEVPLFNCYTFVRVVPTVENRVKVLSTSGALSFVGNERLGTPIPDEEIGSLRTAIREKIPYALHPYVSVGKRVRIRGGSLDGVEGILVGQGADQSLVVSVELLHRSVSIRVDGYDVELA
jgi:transcription antitermination factor NusG